MANEYGDQFPDPVMIPLAELRAVITALDSLSDRLLVAGDWTSAERLEVVLGRMARWIWGLLSDLDGEDGYDE